MNFKNRIGVLCSGSLFVKIAGVVVCGILLISAFTLAAAFHAARQGFIRTMEQSNEQILSMVQANMENMNDEITNVELTVNNSWDFARYFSSNQNSLQTSQQVYNMVKQLNEVKPSTFYDVAVIGVSGKSYVSNQSSLSLSVTDLLNCQITRDAREHPNQILYRYVSSGITQHSRDSSAFIALKALTYPGTRSIYGFAYIVMTQQDLLNFFDSLGNGTNNLMLLDSTGTVVSAPNRAVVGERDEELERILNDMDTRNDTSRYAELQNEQVLVLARTMPRWNLHIVSVFDYQRAFDETGSKAYILAVCLLVTAAVLAAVFFFIRQITMPIHLLVRTMEHVTEDGLPDHIEVVGGGYEVRKLSSAFSLMIENLNGYVKRLIELEEEKRRMEVRTLQMQINPHFIYNTLTSIKWLIWKNDPEKAVQSIDTFTQLLRNTINGSRKLIPVQEEVENLKNYIFLQKIRFGQQIQTDIILSPAAENCMIPKLLLQPFLENAFFHAFPDRRPGIISIAIGCHGGNLVCEMIDNGVGMTQAKADSLLSADSRENGHSVGIPNVNSRIRLLFGDCYGVKIFSEPGCGTSVKVTLPVIPSQKESE